MKLKVTQGTGGWAGDAEKYMRIYNSIDLEGKKREYMYRMPFDAAPAACSLLFISSSFWRE